MKTPALDGDGDPELARPHWLAALFPDDRMFAQIKALAQASLNEQASIATANKPSLAADRDAHLVWATKRWIEQHAPRASGSADVERAGEPSAVTLPGVRLLALADRAGLGPGAISGLVQTRLELFAHLVAGDVLAQVGADQAQTVEAGSDAHGNHAQRCAVSGDHARGTQHLDLCAIQAAALQAGAGQWSAHEGIVWFADGDSALIADPVHVTPPVFLASDSFSSWPEPIAREDVATFTALACPATVLALIQRLRLAEQSRDTWKERCERQAEFLSTLPTDMPEINDDDLAALRKRCLALLGVVRSKEFHLGEVKRELDELRAKAHPELLDSERQANAMLTDENERLQRLLDCAVAHGSARQIDEP